MSYLQQLSAVTGVNCVFNIGWMEQNPIPEHVNKAVKQLEVTISLTQLEQFCKSSYSDGWRQGQEHLAKCIVETKQKGEQLTEREVLDITGKKKDEGDE